MTGQLSNVAGFLFALLKRIMKMKLYLVTSYEDIRWGDSLFVKGAFTTKDKAMNFVKEQHIENYKITMMTVDHPKDDSDSYPFAYYEE